MGDDQKAETWKPPEIEKAKAARRRALWRDGEEHLATSLRSMGEMGVGMELYFFMTRQLALLFTWLSLLHLPAMINHARVLPCLCDGVAACAAA